MISHFTDLKRFKADLVQSLDSDLDSVLITCRIWQIIMFYQVECDNCDVCNQLTVKQKSNLLSVG